MAVLRVLPAALTRLAALSLMVGGLALFAAVLGTGIAPVSFFASVSGDENIIWMTANDTHLTGAFLVMAAGALLFLASHLSVVRIRARNTAAAHPGGTSKL